MSQQPFQLERVVETLAPSDPRDYGRALWYEEYADTKLVEVATPAFFERFVKVVVLKQQPDEARVRKALDEQAPPVFDYLEGELGGREWFAGPRFSTADVAVASPFVNLMHVGERLDAKRWPRLAAWHERTHGRPSFKALMDEERAGMPRR